MKESDLYPALERHFTKQGYEVKGEVCGCDLVGLRSDGSLVIVELKLSFNTKLLYQAVRRLRITEEVYVALPKPSGKKIAAQWSMMRSLCRRLNIGLILISRAKTKKAEAKVVIEPAPFRSTKSSKEKEKILKEFKGRKAGYNQGGVNGAKIQTAYLEQSILVAVLLTREKKASAAALRKLGAPEKCYTILYKNHYGWFMKKEKGIYALRRGIQKEIKRKYPEIWAYYEKAVSIRPGSS